MHSKIVKSSNQSKFTREEWILAAGSIDSITITGKLKQQNPFTDEFIFMDVIGAGYWIPVKSKYEGWPGDGSVVIRPNDNGIIFIQFSDINDVELNEIAAAVGGRVVPHEEGR